MRRKLWAMLLPILLALASTAAAQGGTIGGGIGSGGAGGGAGGGAAAAGTLTGTILASNVVTSSLTSVTGFTFGLGTLTGGASSLVFQAGTGNSRTLTLQTTTSGGVATTAVRFNEAQQALFAAGTSTRPSISFAVDTTMGFNRAGSSFQASFNGNARVTFGNTALTVASIPILIGDGSVGAPAIALNGAQTTGIYRFGSTGDTLAIATAGVHSLRISGGATPTIAGGAGSFTLLAGIGNARTLTLQSSNSAGTATTFTSGSGDTLKITAHAIAAGLTAAVGTPHTMCLDPTTHEVEDNAALTCTVSARRFKRDIAALSLAEAKRIIMGLKPSTFTMRSGDRKSIGLIAEEVDEVDPRLTFRDDYGRLNSVDYQALAPILISIVQEQQRQIDELVATRIGSVTAERKYDNIDKVLAFLSLTGAATGVGAVVIRRRPSLSINLRA